MIEQQQKIPYESHWLPWLGHGLAFGQDADALIQRLQQKHGSEFSIMLGGKRTTFLCNPHDFPSLFRETEKLSAEPIGRRVSSRAFTTEFHKCEGDLHDLHTFFAQQMSKGKIKVPSELMAKALAKRIQAIDAGQLQRAPMMRFVGELIFEAGAEALFGNALSETLSSYDDFVEYDKRFPMYVAGLPLRWFFPKQWRYIKSMEAQLEEVQGPLPKLLSDYYTMLEKERIPLEVRGQFVAGLFWAAQANTIVMAFYAIYYLLKEPNAAVAIQEEIDRVLLKHGCTPETLNYLALNDLTLLDAFLER